jgi:hypothetical protein
VNHPGFDPGTPRLCAISDSPAKRRIVIAPNAVLKERERSRKSLHQGPAGATAGALHMRGKPCIDRLKENGGLFLGQCDDNAVGFADAA